MILDRMARLIIKKIGPIESIDTTFKKINIIIGPQSSGKSTINKIACFCTWVEKKVCLEQSFDFFLEENHFIDNLIIFHKMKGYFQEESYIEYESEVLKFSYLYKENKPKFTWKDQYNYIRPQISYIPAERNIVSLLDDWDEIKLPENNTFNFMTDWNIARKQYTSEHHLPVDFLDTKYYYEENSKSDFLEMENGKKIRLTDGSSGQQSMIPLYILIIYYTQVIYNQKQKVNIKNKERDKRLMESLFFHTMQGSGIQDDQDMIKKMFLALEGQVDFSEKGKEIVQMMSKNFSRFLEVNFTSLFIEEPELNLFPSTQIECLYFIIRSMKQKNHQLFLTTHSPYVLYALNNCMMGELVRNHIPEDIAKDLPSYAAWIHPDEVQVWQIEQGKLISIKEKTTGTIGTHYFNQIMNENLNEYYNMLNFLRL